MRSRVASLRSSFLRKCMVYPNPIIAIEATITAMRIHFHSMLSFIDLVSEKDGKDFVSIRFVSPPVLIEMA